MIWDTQSSNCSRCGDTGRVSEVRRCSVVRDRPLEGRSETEHRVRIKTDGVHSGQEQEALASIADWEQDKGRAHHRQCLPMATEPRALHAYVKVGLYGWGPHYRSFYSLCSPAYYAQPVERSRNPP